MNLRDLGDTMVKLFLVSLCSLMLSGNLFSGPSKELKELKADLKASINQSVQYLRDQQKEGKWMSHPGVTALALDAILGCYRGYEENDGPWIREPASWLLSLQQEDGAIYDPNSRAPTKNYVTALSILALKALKNPFHDKAIEKARDFLVGIQVDEGEGYHPEKDYFYGGIGYGGDQRPDLSNLQLALEALHASGLPKDHSTFKKAMIFIRRCHDIEGNSMEWAGSSGGFAYSPDLPTNRNLPTVKEKGEVVVPYGSMTFAGLKSLIYCEVSSDDRRVQMTLDWVSKNYSVADHPKFGQNSIFYYYQTMARALEVAGVNEIKVGDVSRDWRADLASELLKRQKKDGSWVNDNPKYMEGVPILCTAYALNALNVIYRAF